MTRYVGYGRMAEEESRAILPYPTLDSTLHLFYYSQVLNHMMSHLAFREPGTSQLVSTSPPTKKLKMGLVSISVNDIETQLNALDHLAVHPVTLKPSKLTVVSVLALLN